MSDVFNLSRRYEICFGGTTVDRVEVSIFKVTYFFDCMSCSFCKDLCCSHGVDVDVTNVNRLLEHASALEKLTGHTKDKWFNPDFTVDKEFPGGQFTRTNVVDGYCIFFDKSDRGCLIHKYALSLNIDFHEIKPIVSTLFPLTFDDGLLHPSDEASDKSLVCLGEGSSLYRGIRNDLLYYFGNDFINELDGLEKSIAMK